MTKKLWGGRFSKQTDELVEKFTRSIQYDKKLAEYDILGSLLHIRILRKAGILTPREFTRLNGALASLLGKVQAGMPIPDMEEDIHTFIQGKVLALAGDAGLKLHTARSRNDQIAFASKLYCIDMLSRTITGILKLEQSLLSLSAENSDLIIPGFTHLQHAQPVYVGDYLGAYVEMLKRDNERLAFIKGNIRLTMGSGALAGTPIACSHYRISAAGIPRFKEMGIGAIEATVNPLDAVSDRDFVIETVSALSVLAMHLSRVAEDLVIWATREFAFVEIDDAYCTGSSLMPQKKNPDVLELVRGYAGRLYGNLISELVMMKGLPLTYNRDMQLDKEPLFGSFEIIEMELEVMAGLVKTVKFNRPAIERHLSDESLYATDLAYYLVGKGIPFSQAHSTVGKLVRYSLERSVPIVDMTQESLAQFSDKLDKKEISRLLNARVSVKGKISVNRGNRKKRR